MKGALLFNSRHHKQKSSFIAFFNKFILLPAKSGLYGFATFFTVFILAKGIINFLGITDYYVVTADDVLFSSLGFVIAYFVKLVKNIVRKTNG